MQILPLSVSRMNGGTCCLFSLVLSLTKHGCLILRVLSRRGLLRKDRMLKRIGNSLVLLMHIACCLCQMFLAVEYDLRVFADSTVGAIHYRDAF